LGTWPSNLDLNPVENVWHIKCAIRKRPQRPIMEANLIKTIRKKCKKINKLILSISHRLTEVRKVKGGAFNY
jgi:hypothetical protein